MKLFVMSLALVISGAASADQFVFSSVSAISTYVSNNQVYREIDGTRGNDKNVYGLQIPVSGNNAVVLEDCMRLAVSAQGQANKRLIISYKLNSLALPIVDLCQLQKL